MAARRAQGLTREAVWHQTTPMGTFAIVVLEGDDIQSSLGMIATSGVVLAACYMLWMYRRVMFGPVDNAENRRLIDLSLREKLVMVAIVIPIVWIGVYPETFLSRIRPSVVDLRERMRERGGFEIAVAPEAGVEAEAEEEQP